jgi:hypothetical protein
MLVILSIPNKEVEQINNISIISGEGIAKIVLYIVTHKQTIHPKNPATLLLLTPESAESICLKNLFI